MNTSPSSLASVLALALVFAGQQTVAVGQQDAQGGALTARVQSERGVLEWHFKGRKLLAYAFATNQFKPYVRELYSLAGENVLLDAPSDHLHHHGLMYAIRVNGVNFWEERDQPGHQRHIELLAQRVGRSAQGLPQASFTERVQWVPHGDHTQADTTRVALLLEKRTLTLTVDEPRQEVALAWHAEFAVGARTNRIKLEGADYHGLGLRLAPAWDHVARHLNSEGGSTRDGGKPCAVPARWSSVSRTADEGAAQVVLFARPRGHAGINTFFTMTEAFTYLSATQGLDKAPLEYGVGDRFSLDYLILVFPTAHTSSQLEERYQLWASELKSNEK